MGILLDSMSDIVIRAHYCSLPLSLQLVTLYTLYIHGRSHLGIPSRNNLISVLVIRVMTSHRTLLVWVATAVGLALNPRLQPLGIDPVAEAMGRHCKVGCESHNSIVP